MDDTCFFYSMDYLIYYRTKFLNTTNNIIATITFVFIDNLTGIIITTLIYWFATQLDEVQQKAHLPFPRLLLTLSLVRTLQIMHLN